MSEVRMLHFLNRLMKIHSISLILCNDFKGHIGHHTLKLWYKFGPTFQIPEAVNYLPLPPPPQKNVNKEDIQGQYDKRPIVKAHFLYAISNIIISRRAISKRSWRRQIFWSILDVMLLNSSLYSRCSQVPERWMIYKLWSWVFSSERRRKGKKNRNEYFSKATRLPSDIRQNVGHWHG